MARQERKSNKNSKSKNNRNNRSKSNRSERKNNNKENDSDSECDRFKNAYEFGFHLGPNVNC